MEPTKIDARVLLRDRLVLAAGLAALLLLGGSAWLLFGSRGEADSHFTHMHCSVCRDEAPYDARKEGQLCNSCEKGTYIPTVGSILDGSGESWGATARGIVLVLIAIVVVQGMAYLALSRLRSAHQAVEEASNQMVVCRCPFCDRKIGYRITRAGTGAVCSRCKTAFVLPPAQGDFFECTR